MFGKKKDKKSATFAPTRVNAMLSTVLGQPTMTFADLLPKHNAKAVEVSLDVPRWYVQLLRFGVRENAEENMVAAKMIQLYEASPSDTLGSTIHDWFFLANENDRPYWLNLSTGSAPVYEQAFQAAHGPQLGGIGMGSLGGQSQNTVPQNVIDALVKELNKNLSDTMSRFLAAGYPINVRRGLMKSNMKPAEPYYKKVVASLKPIDPWFQKCPW